MCAQHARMQKNTKSPIPFQCWQIMSTAWKGCYWNTVWVKKVVPLKCTRWRSHSWRDFKHNTKEGLTTVYLAPSPPLHSLFTPPPHPYQPSGPVRPFHAVPRASSWVTAPCYALKWDIFFHSLGSHQAYNNFGSEFWAHQEPTLQLVCWLASWNVQVSWGRGEI